MEIKIKELEDLNKAGIYLIRNIVNNKVYIGSTSKTFRTRYTSHKSKLSTGKHGTPHLQLSWNKYGGHSFEFIVLEVCDKSDLTFILEREKEYIRIYKACFRNTGFNNNSDPFKSCALEPEVQRKISETLKRKYRDGTLLRSKSCFKKGIIPWNSGIKYTDTSFMKKPKTITDDLRQAWENTSIRNRERSDFVEVYDMNNTLIYTARSLIDLNEWSVSDDNFLPITSKHGKELVSAKISKACKTGKPYKKLYFKFRKKSL